MVITKVFLALRSEVYCLGIDRFIQVNFKDRLSVAGSTYSFKNIGKTCSIVSPDILIIDNRFLDGECAEIIAEIKMSFCNIKVIGVSEIYNLKTSKMLKKSGACGYFSYSDDRTIMIDLIERVLKLPAGFEPYDFQESKQ
jgi:DNA-binding NarL/FixJ family response regulator